MRALAVLALVPIGAIVLLTTLGGVAPQNHWGATTTVLIPLLLIARLGASGPRSIAAAATATALCHLGAIAWNVVVWKIDPGPDHRFAARALAALAQSHWSQHERGPIRLVLGPDWEAGAIALYLPGHPVVLPNADAREAPWIDGQLISRCGALVIGRTDQPIELEVPSSQARSAIDVTVLAARDSQGRVSAVKAALIAPEPGLGCR